VTLDQGLWPAAGLVIRIDGAFPQGPAGKASRPR
jgi:hypothetical protein